MQGSRLIQRQELAPPTYPRGAEAPAKATKPPVVQDKVPADANVPRSLLVLPICHKCEMYDGNLRACKHLLNDGGKPCWAELKKRMERGQPCPHPSGDKWIDI